MAEQTRAVRVDKFALEAAQRFLEELGAKRCTFQTFDDNAKRKDKTLACILHGSLDEHADQLVELNRLGAGVFVAVNQTDGRGRKRENIKRVRAVTADLDGAPPDPVRLCALKPQIIVESSPGRYHAYWLVKEFGLDLFEDVQRAIAKRFDGDPEIAKLTHVARLPGFYHRKAEPFLVRTIETNDLPRYTAEAITKEFPQEKVPHKLPVSLAGREVLPAGNPVACARRFVDQNFRTSDGDLRLQYYRGSYYHWMGTQFTEIDSEELRSKLYGYLEDAVTLSNKVCVPFNPTAAKVNGILDALKSGVLQPPRKDAPFWIEPVERSANGLIACRNGLLDISKRKLVPNSAYFFNVNSLPFDYDDNAPTYPKLWMKFLRELWPDDLDDKQARLTLQEIFGLLLTPDTRHQKIFMLVGPKRSGKGTIGRLLTALLGKENVANPTLASLSSHFGLAPLIDKRAAIISDARLGPQTNAHTVAERLLAISGEDSQTIDRKYREPWTGRLGARFLVLTNELPRIADTSGALASRFVILLLKNSFYGREDHNLEDKLLTELPGILNWSLRGLDGLRERGRFKMPEASVQLIRQLEDLASPVAAFIREWGVVDPSARISVKEFYDAYVKWCESEGCKPGSNIVFGRNLRAVMPHVEARGAGIDRFYQGVALTEDARERYELALRAWGRN